MKRLAVVVLFALSGAATAAGEAICDDHCLEAKGLPVPIERAVPKYPDEAAAAHLEGCVVVSFVIDPHGLADQFIVLDSQPKGIFDAPTLRALVDWKFKVPKKPGRYAQRLDYRLSGGSSKAPDCIASPSYDELNKPKPKAKAK